jgi:hypothetical protein
VKNINHVPLIIQFPVASRYLFPLISNYAPQLQVLKYPQSRCLKIRKTDLGGIGDAVDFPRAAGFLLGNPSRTARYNSHL